MFERCVYFNTNALVRHLNRRWDAAFAVTGLSASQAYVLRAVCQADDLSQQQLATQMNLEKSTVTRLISSLVAKKLLQRQAGADNRQYRLQASEKGRKLCVQLDAIGQQLYLELRTHMGAQQFDTLVKQTRNAVTALS